MIDSLKIKNFKCFSDCILDLKQLTVFAGSNSVGKSTAIQSLLLSRIAAEKIEQLQKDIQIPLNGKYALSLGNSKDILTKDAPTNFISLIIHDSGSKEDLNLQMIAEDNENNYNLELSLEDKEIYLSTIFLREFYYLAAERIGPRLNYDVEQLDYFHVGWQGEYTVQILGSNKEQPVENFEKRKFGDSMDNKLLNQVRYWLDFVTPGIYIDDAILYGQMKKAQTLYSKHSPTNVGFGISYVLPIIVNGLIAKENRLFLIENPEAHLHPKGQSNIGYFLGKLAISNLQVIIETHSEHVINGIRLAMVENDKKFAKNILINFFSRKEKDDGVEIKKIFVSESGDLTDFPLDFFDQAQQDLLRIYSASNKPSNG